MGFLQKFRSLFIIDDAPQTATHTATEQRAEGYPMNDFWRGWGDLTNTSTSGVSVTRETALSVPAIWAAVDTISKTLASLPFSLYNVTSEGSAPAKSHPVYGVIKEPSPFTTSYSFRYALFAQACFGDAYAKIHRNGVGRAASLELLDTDSVTLFQRDSGEYYYVVRRQIGNRYSEEAISWENMIHVKGLTLDGMMGKSVTSIQRDSIGTSIAAEQYGNYFFANGASPSGALVYPQALQKNQRDEAERKISEKYGGIRKSGKVMILDAGVKFEKMSIDPEQASMNETRNFQVNQASRIFGVPVPLLAQLDNATLNNMETMGIQFVTLCLRPWAVQVEQEFARKLLTRNERISEVYFFRFNFAGLLRGDTQARAEYYKAALGGPSTGIGWMSVNEVRELENLDRVDDGDDVFTAEMVMQAQNQQGAEQDTQNTPSAEDDNANDNGTPQASNGQRN